MLSNNIDELSNRLFKLPNLLDATTEFMSRAGQLDEPPIIDDWMDFGIPEPDRYRQTRETAKLRHRLLREEYREYMDAREDNDLVEMVDAWLDIIVIAWGSLLAYLGPEKAEAAAREVVRSNLSKVDGSLGPMVKRDDGKVMKPEGWTPPDIRGALGL